MSAITHLAAPSRDGKTQLCARCGADITPPGPGWWPFNHAIAIDEERKSGADVDAGALGKATRPPDCEGPGGPAPTVGTLLILRDRRVVAFAVLSSNPGEDKAACERVMDRLCAGVWMPTRTWPGVGKLSVGVTLVESCPALLDLPTDRLLSREDIPAGIDIPVAKLFGHRWHRHSKHAPAIAGATTAVQ